MRFHLVVLAAVATLNASCGSAFVKGWRNKDRPAPTAANSCTKGKILDNNNRCVEQETTNFSLISDEQKCRDTGIGHWIAGKCVMNRESQTADECRAIDGWAWIEGVGCRSEAEAQCLAQPGKAYANGQCIGQPTLETSGGALSQAIVAGSGLVDIELKASPGAVVRRDHDTCKDFLIIKGTKLVSGDTYKLPAGLDNCSVDLVPTVGAADGKALHVALTFEHGFYDLCIGEPNEPTPSEMTSIFAVEDLLKKFDCKEANDELIKQSGLNFSTTATSEISDLSVLRGLKKLERLNLSGNDVIDLTPLAGLSGLKTLNLNDNRRLHDLSPLAKLAGLQLITAQNTSVNINRTEASCPTAAGTPSRLAAICKQ